MGAYSLYAMGMTRRLANRFDLAAMIPNGELSSTGYCLANPGDEYLIYQPKSNETFSVVLVKGLYQFSWINTQKGDEVMSGRIESHGGRSQFKAPFDGDFALYIKTVNDSE